MKDSEKEPYKFKILGCIGIIPFIPLMVVLFVPWMVSVRLYQKCRDEVLYRRLKAMGRVLAWPEVDEHLTLGEGTLVIEQTNKVGVRFWWTPDDLFALSPMPPVANLEELDGYVTGRSSNPFVAWCAANYLSVEKGKAFLTQFDRQTLPPGPMESAYFQDLYPRARIVQTLLGRP